MPPHRRPCSSTSLREESRWLSVCLSPDCGVAEGASAFSCFSLSLSHSRSSRQTAAVEASIPSHHPSPSTPLRDHLRTAAASASPCSDASPSTPLKNASLRMTAKMGHHGLLAGGGVFYEGRVGRGGYWVWG